MPHGVHPETGIRGQTSFPAGLGILRLRNVPQILFFITDGQRGDRLFDTRYTPAVAAAMAEAYPRIERQAGLTIHLPPE